MEKEKTIKEEKIYVIKEKEKVGKFEIGEWKKKLPPLMKCGHQAQSIWYAPKELNNKKIWVCVICDGKESKVIQNIPSDFGGRFECNYRCGSFAEWDKVKRKWIVNLSSKGGWNATYNGNKEIEHLPFLDIKEKKFYCGCKGCD